MAKRRYGVTEKRITKYRAEGRGKGRLADYQPWLRIQNVPSTGLSTRILGSVTARIHHFLSQGESEVFLDCDWHRSVTDIREQFPLDRGETIGLAEVMGVPHPADHGVDSVMTTDIVVDYVVAGEPRRVAFSMKPAAELENARTIEKLEIERRFWKRRDVPFHILTEHERSTVRARNLQMLHEWRSLKNLTPPKQGFEETFEVLMLALRGRPTGRLFEAMAAIDREHGWNDGDSLAALRHLAANRRVHIDVDVPFDPRGPMSQVWIEAAQARTAA